VLVALRTKVIGAGSIGNHLSHAARALGWPVDLCDVDPRALERTRSQIYPSRYGQWDDAIRLFDVAEAPRGGYDLIVIGTPPDIHIPLALQALDEGPRALLIEKPVCGPALQGADELRGRADREGIPVFVGYDHVVGKAARMAAELVRTADLGSITTLDVEFREHWAGIFNAHPWLAGPWETYLGFWQRGGGASGEHSHATNLWQHFAQAAGAGRVVEVQATLDTVTDNRVDYDRLCLMNLRSEQGLVGRCVQDVITQPPRKWARIQGERGSVEWLCGREPGVDAVVALLPGRAAAEQRVSKTRPDDFIEELTHIEGALASDPAQSPIALSRGLDTMLVVAAAHLSQQTGKRVRVDYDAGYSRNALSTY
jgi:predicted dehydrogenase